VQTAIVIPPVAETVTGKFAGIMAFHYRTLFDF
jgi:hypothetical protein